MPSRKTMMTFMACCCLLAAAPAQQAKYADAYTGYHAQVAGVIGNLLHVWSASGDYSLKAPRHISLMLQVFSEDMRLVTEKKIDLGEINSWSVYFHHQKDAYLANIVCMSDTNKRIMLKVDAGGNYTDVSGTPFPGGVYNSVDERNRFAAIFRKNNHLYSIEISNAKNTGASNISFISGKTVAPGNNYQQIVIRKTDFNTGRSLQSILGSAETRFYYPLITVTDTAVLVSAVSDYIADKKSNKSALLLLARLDSNLKLPVATHVLVQPTRFIKNEIYSPVDIIDTKNGVFVLSKGLYRRESVSVRYETQNGFTVPVPTGTHSYSTSSLKIAVVNEKNNWLKDTIIETSGGNKNLLLDNMFTVASGNGIDLFLARKFSGSKQGVTHFSINTNAQVKTEDMMVDIKYDYLMGSTKNIAAGVLLVPVARNWRRGLMKLEYEPVQ